MTKIREGYKETEVGVIPEDWDVKPLGEITDIISGGTPKTIIKEYWENGSILWATPTDITGNKNKYISKTERKITKSGLENSSANMLPIGSVLMTSRATIGERCINTKPMSTNQGFKSFICHNVLFNEFLYYYIELIRNEMLSMSSGSTFKEISKSKVETLNIALPLFYEQQQIAEILSTTDEYIEKLDKIIEDYELLKKGMIQRLLSEGIGHTELKDSEIGRIPKEWEVKRLDECFEFFGGYSASRAELSEEGVLYLHYGDIHLRTRSYIDTNDDSGWMPRYDVNKEKKGASLDNGDIVFADASEDYEGVGKSVVIMKDSEDIVAGLHTLVAKEKSEKFELVFKRYFLNASYVRSQFRKLATGAKVYGISKGNIGQILVCMPTKEEQILIGDTLASLEHHIEVLIKEKEEVSTLKKELMNRLLTGKVRAI